MKRRIISLIVALAFLGVPCFANILIFPHFVDGPGFMTTVTLMNTSDSSFCELEITIFNDDGSKASFKVNGYTINDTLDITLPPLGSYALKTDGSATSFTSGWIYVNATGIVSGSVLFSSNYGTAGVLGTGLSTDSIVPVKINTAANINTGIAIVNPGQMPLNFHLSILSPTGREELSTNDQQVPANGRIVSFLTDLFPGMPNPFEGIVKVTAEQAVACMALQTGPGFYATVPVTPATIASGEVYDVAAINKLALMMTIQQTDNNVYTVNTELESDIPAHFLGTDFVLEGTLITGTLHFYDLDYTLQGSLGPNMDGMLTTSPASFPKDGESATVIGFRRHELRAGYVDGCYFTDNYEIIDISGFTGVDALEECQSSWLIPYYFKWDGVHLYMYSGFSAMPFTLDFNPSTGEVSPNVFVVNDQEGKITIEIKSLSFPDYKTTARATMNIHAKLTIETDIEEGSLEFLSTGVRR